MLNNEETENASKSWDLPISCINIAPSECNDRLNNHLMSNAFLRLRVKGAIPDDTLIVAMLKKQINQITLLQA